MIAWLVYSQQSEYYSGPIFPQIIKYLSENPKCGRLKENKDKLILNFGSIESVQQAFEKVKSLSESINF